MRKPELWSCRDEEVIDHEDMDEAIREFLEEIEPPLPATIKVHGYARMKMKLDHQRIIDAAYDQVEEFDDPNGCGLTMTPLMQKAAEVFCSVFEAEFFVWACERVETRTIDVRRWVALEASHWDVRIADL